MALEKLYLTGITGHPPQRMITKTALGAEDTVPWQHSPETAKTVAALRSANYEIAAIETSAHSIDLFDWQPRFPVCVLFGHETDGLTPQAAAMADTHVRIPMLGRKHSLNVASGRGRWFCMSCFGKFPGVAIEVKWDLRLLSPYFITIFSFFYRRAAVLPPHEVGGVEASGYDSFARRVFAVLFDKVFGRAIHLELPDQGAARYT